LGAGARELSVGFPLVAPVREEEELEVGREVVVVEVGRLRG
jgi:hypothetical protein